MYNRKVIDHNHYGYRYHAQCPACKDWNDQMFAGEDVSARKPVTITGVISSLPDHEPTPSKGRIIELDQIVSVTIKGYVTSMTNPDEAIPLEVEITDSWLIGQIQIGEFKTFISIFEADEPAKPEIPPYVPKHSKAVPR